VVSLIRGVIQEDSFALNPQYAAPSPVAKDTILIPYLSKSCISSMEEIGQGFFGKVYKGLFTQIFSGPIIFSDNTSLITLKRILYKCNIKTRLNHDKQITLFSRLHLKYINLIFISNLSPRNNQRISKIYKEK